MTTKTEWPTRRIANDLLKWAKAHRDFEAGSERDRLEELIRALTKFLRHERKKSAAES